MIYERGSMVFCEEVGAIVFDLSGRIHRLNEDGYVI